MITLLAKAIIQEGKEKEFEQAFAAIAEKVKETEPDNHLYKLCRSQSASNEYTMVEFYTAPSALEFHMNNPAIKDLMGAVGPFFKAAPEVVIVDDVVGS